MSAFKFEAWPTESKIITQHFGTRPDYYAQFGLPGHEGIDMQAQIGTSIFCVAPGTVSAVHQDDGQHPYGTNVRVRHADGYETIYAHLSETSVAQGQDVSAGDVLGKAGETGNTDGPHLHLTLKHPDGDAHHYPHNIIDPTPFLMPLLDPNWDDATYVRDTVPDGTVMHAGQAFIQTWWMRNSGASTWGEGYVLARTAGEAMAAPAKMPLPAAPPTAEAPVAVLFRAPSAPGRYRSTWQPCDPDGQFFGDPVWAEIEVADGQVRAVAPSADYVQCRGTEFVVNDQPFRFIGVNLRGLIHYGQRQSDPLRHSRPEHRASQLAAAQRLGARVVRVFLADKDATVDAIAARLRAVLDMVKEQFPDLYLLPAFTNLYNDVPFYAPGDDHFFSNVDGRDLLNREFFAGGYQENYLPFVEQIVTTFRNEPNIFAWEIGNELKLDRANKLDPADPNPHLFIRFNHEVAAAIKRLDPNHMVTTGMKSTHHAWLHTPTMQERLYSSPNIDFITIHSYEGATDQEGDRRVFEDAAVAARLDKPFLVEEAGFDIRIFPDRVPQYRDHLRRWFQLGACGYMPWGFNQTHDTGDGDKRVGFGVELEDWDRLFALFQDRARDLATGAAARGLERLWEAESLPRAVDGATRSLAGFDFQEYNRRYLELRNEQAPNDAAPFGARIAPTAVAAGELYWKVIGVHHLTAVENKGRQHAYVEVLDEAGQRIRDLSMRIAYTWEGRTPDQAAPPVPLDKPADEPAGNVPINRGQHLHLWIEGGGHLSDRVENLHTEHHAEELGPNGEKWNTFGHHSYYVAFQLTRKSATVETGGTEHANGHGGPAEPPPALPPTPPPTPPAALPLRTRRVRVREKLGIDANAPIDRGSGTLAQRLLEPRIIADTQVGWVRLNFIMGPAGERTWEEIYRPLVRRLRRQGLKIYALIGAEAMPTDPGDQFREAPTSSAPNDWIRRYADTFAQIAKLFQREIAVFESFNEPDDWHGAERNWIHPGWFAIMLQEIYDRVHSDPAIRSVTLVSGPLQGLDGNNNAGAGYLRETYQAGKGFFDWGQSRPVPFDGVGYHLYIAQNPTDPATEIPAKYAQYMREVRQVIRDEEGADKPIYISEIGWQTANMSEQKQVECMQAGMQTVADDPSVALGIWFCTEDFAEQFGLYRRGNLSLGGRKLAHTALQDICDQPRDVPVPESAPSAVAPMPRDDARFVRDMVPDGSQIGANTRFTQTWFMRNSGTTTWTAEHELVLIGGETLGGPQHMPLRECPPGRELPLTIQCTAPSTPGRHRGTWQLRNPEGEFFGQEIWLDIEVTAAPEAAAPAVATPSPRAVAAATETASRGLEAEAPASMTRSPLPPTPNDQPLKEYDPELYQAWSRHIQQGFENNNIMFNRILDGFMKPYQTTIWMYRILFGVGIGAFVAAIVLAFMGATADTQPAANAALGSTAIFGGLTVAAFISYFFSRPLQALEENLQFITWLGIVYNTYWTRLVNAMDRATVHQEIEDATQDAIASINEMLDKHAAFSKGRPGLR